VTAERVDEVIAAVERHDAELAGWMRMAADGLTAGEGDEIISQAGLQVFLWYEVPKRHPEDAWRALAEAAGVLLTLLGLDRYAAIARSETTTTILDAWERTSSQGFARFKAAQGRSGVDPPDTELLVWASIFGSAEFAASGSVEDALERAIVAGELHPGAGAWRRAAAAVCDRTLLESPAELGGRTRLRAVLDERIETWILGARPDRLKAWRETAGKRAASDVPPPPDVMSVVAPMRWLLETCRPGTTLTQAGYLPPAVVREAAVRFDWWDWREPPRSEADVHQIGVLRDTAARMHLVAKRSRRLAATRRGIELVDDTVGLWHAIASTIACDDEYLAMLSELLAHRLLQGPAIDDALEQDLGPIIAEQGWTPDGERVTAQHAAWAVSRALYQWRLFGLLDEIRPKWEGGHRTGSNVTALNAAGQSTALAFLRARATAPRTHPGM